MNSTTVLLTQTMLDFLVDFEARCFETDDDGVHQLTPVGVEVMKALAGGTVSGHDPTVADELQAAATKARIAQAANLQSLAP